MDGLDHGTVAGVGEVVMTGVEVVDLRFANLAAGGGGAIVEERRGFGILVSILLRIWTDRLGS